jgi:hypothetical protein
MNWIKGIRRNSEGSTDTTIMSTPINCGACSKKLNPNSEYPQCGKCLSLIHYACTEDIPHHANWRGKNREEQQNWLCPTCVTKTTENHNISSQSDNTAQSIKKTKTDNSGNGTSNQEENPIAEINQKLSVLLSMPADMKLLKDLVIQIQTDHKQMMEEQLNTKVRVVELEKKNAELTKQVENMRIEQKTNLQYQLRNNLLISNVPQQENENTDEVVRKIFTSMKINVTDYDLVRSHRLPKPRHHSNDVPPSIIVKMHRYDTKNQAISTFPGP